MASYLGYFVGLWLIAPIAVYVLRRRRSRFAAHHAAQAALLHLLFGLLLTVCGLLTALVSVIGVLVIDGSSSLALQLFLILACGGWLVPITIHVGLTMISAWLACRGRIDTTSRLGRMTAWLLAQDPGLPPPADG